MYPSSIIVTITIAIAINTIQQNQRLVDAHTEALQKVIEEYDKKVK